MNTKNMVLLLCLFVLQLGISQTEVEVVPPFNIKTVSFVQNGQNTIPIFALSDSFQLQFDDLYGDESNYYYQIVHCNYDWKPSELSINEYISGFDNQRIQDYNNSFNTLQLYSHYKLSFPNKFVRFLVSGNFMIKILNEDKEVVFSRKIVLFENLVTVPMQVKRARNVRDIELKQNLEFAVKSSALFQNPIENIKVLLLKNGQFKDAIANIKPLFTIGNDLIYKYATETQFWGGNESMYFENKIIQTANNNVQYVDAKDIYNSHLYTNQARANLAYTYFPDINGNFEVLKSNADNSSVEADYAWVYFSLSAPAYYGESDIYVTGMFNNYAMIGENKMEFNTKKGLFEKAILIKQGFTNYGFTMADDHGNIDYKNAIDGNFSQTENNYFTIIYYRENGQRYDRVVGKGVASSINITN